MDRYEDVSDCEVDHSFFDSDFEGEAKKDGTTRKSAKTENTDHNQIDGTNVSKPGLKTDPKVAEGVYTNEEMNEKEPQVEHASHNGTNENALPLFPLNLENASTSGRTSAQGKITHKTGFPTQVPKIVKEHEENYYTDEEDSSDDSRNQKVRLKLSKQSSSSKMVKKTAVSTSSSSSSPSCTSDTDCSDADSDGCLSDSSCSPSKKKDVCSFALLSPRQKSKPGIKSVEVKPKLCDCAEESEDTVTDVTPLSTPDISPASSFELAASNDKKLKIKRQENVSQDVYEPEKERRCHQKVLHEAVDLNHLLKAFLQLEKKEQQNLVLDPPSIGSRKNYSFTNDEVRQIDQENQRLLKELAKHSGKPRSKSASLKKPSGPAPKMYHSAINRQKEQQRIDRENLAFLKRLEAVKPTVGMKRSEQLMDYQRQMSYLNAAPPAPRRGKSALSHHSPSRGASRSSSHSASSTASRRSERPVFDSSRGGLQRLNSAKVQAAWL
ncbi:cilia- and flagella-associated protein 97 [Eublepharis macularius]|uniref:Cilia- and flagella-associated protein 97 n=1 Tax=Eublepharis macularius TaxID=481883 RepID=A0AA97JWB0_EUBMA|nr:cilia- and flagella-associated protein 97 [Eublepharis macularius]XP_054845476.1 cilia- and flagella-associated protein 97 [Eublepharis macularius]